MLLLSSMKPASLVNSPVLVRRGLTGIEQQLPQSRSVRLASLALSDHTMKTHPWGVSEHEATSFPQLVVEEYTGKMKQNQSTMFPAPAILNVLLAL